MWFHVIMIKGTYYKNSQSYYRYIWVWLSDLGVRVLFIQGPQQGGAPNHGKIRVRGQVRGPPRARIWSAFQPTNSEIRHSDSFFWAAYFRKHVLHQAAQIWVFLCHKRSWLELYLPPCVYLRLWLEKVTNTHDESASWLAGGRQRRVIKPIII